MAKKQALRPWLGVAEGVAFASAASVAGILLFALAIKVFTLSDEVIPVVNQLIKVVSILLGTWRAVRKGIRGVVGGLLVGAIYAAAGLTIYAVIEGILPPVSVILGDLLLGSAAGAVGGILIANLLKR